MRVDLSASPLDAVESGRVSTAASPWLRKKRTDFIRSRNETYSWKLLFDADSPPFHRNFNAARYSSSIFLVHYYIAIELKPMNRRKMQEMKEKKGKRETSACARTNNSLDRFDSWLFLVTVSVLSLAVTSIANHGPQSVSSLDDAGNQGERDSSLSSRAIDKTLRATRWPITRSDSS